MRRRRLNHGRCCACDWLPEGIGRRSLALCGVVVANSRVSAARCMGESHSRAQHQARKAHNRNETITLGRLRVQMTRKCNRGFRMGSGATRVSRQNDAVS